MSYLRKCFYLLVFSGFSLSNAGSFDDFIAAIKIDNAYGVKRLLDEGKDPNAEGPQGAVALFVAIKDESFAAAQALLDSPRTQVNVLNSQRESPLMLAAIKGQLSLCQKLVERGALINLPGWSPLHYAAAGPSVAVTEWLLTSGAVVNALSPNKTTPLMMAAGYGAISSAQLLMSKGADLKLRNEAGLNAADFAQKAGREALAEELTRAANKLTR